MYHTLRSLLHMAALLLWIVVPFQVIAEETYVDDGASADELSNEEGWLLVKERAGIQVYMKHQEGSRLKTFRGMTTITVSDPNACYEIFNDYDALATWMQYVHAVSDVSRVSDFDRNVRVIIALPWPIADREALLHATVTQIPEKRMLEVELLNAPDMLPPNKGIVRIPEFRGKIYFRMISDTEVEVMYQVILDLAGYIPTWLANIVLQDAPYFTLRRMEKALNNPKYQNIEDARLIFAGG